ncbi:osmotically inducible protein Y [Bordetella ansorpii]|uniref:Osmotically inducible protein Y n=1 Tax=Bordetella ansorpii TaxID=288768 RepID=A0A157MC65_9BORD|nr:hypothetical protein [Bordetella ansorpii]SAI06677.1 osmotically inducible protein Y [Bordetella ansorpii]
MRNEETSSKPGKTPAGTGDPKQPREKSASHEAHTRQSGNFGADEPDYGRAQGEKPNPGQGGQANPKGPEYEQGGRYPGTRQGNGGKDGGTGKSDPAHGRRERG